MSKSEFELLYEEILDEAEKDGPAAMGQMELYKRRFDLANQMINLRKSRGLSQSDLAKLCGVAQPEISRIESARTFPNTETIHKIAAALNVQLSLGA